MPHYRQVKVEVLDAGATPLEEHGEITNNRMKMVSCFIQSETNKSFRIGIQPDQALLWRSQPEVADEGNIPGPNLLKPSWRTVQRNLPGLPGYVDEFGRSNALRQKPWHFIATLRLDGRRNIEKRDFVILDQDHEDFKSETDGYTKLKGVTVRDQNGVWHKCDWIFKDVGIDTVFDNLELSGEDAGASPAQLEEDLANAFGAMSASKQNEPEEPSKVGQIEVRLDRVTLGRVEEGYHSSDSEEKEMSQLPGSAIKQAEHTVGRAEYKKGRAPTQTVYFHEIDGDNAPYAIFRFNYCDESTSTNPFYAY